MRSHDSQGEVSRDFFEGMLCIQTEQGENEDSAKAETVQACRVCAPRPL